MAERLIIDCVRNGEKIATLCFRWSANTDSAYT